MFCKDLMQKKQNQQEHQQKVAKVGKDECRDKFHHCRDKIKGK